MSLSEAKGMTKNMKRAKRICSIFLTVLILLSVFMTFVDVSAATKIPSINSKVTVKNVQNLLKKYDPDGAYILQKQIQAGSDILVWFSGGDRILDSVETAVHEETHGYSDFYARNFGETAYFVGNKKTIYVPYTKVYKSKKMAASIPKRLRTFRYDIYVAKPSAYLSSNVDGAYGLMNEFMAYRAGMKTSVSMFPYLKSQNADWDTWQVYITSCENGRLAYAEFKYYILHYLYYAKNHYPDVYRGIVNNKAFCRAYKKLESSYAKLIKTYTEDLEKLESILEKPGYTLRISDENVIYMGEEIGSGPQRFTEDYKALTKECGKKKYQSIHNVLVKRGE